MFLIQYLFFLISKLFGTIGIKFKKLKELKMNALKRLSLRRVVKNYANPLLPSFVFLYTPLKTSEYDWSTDVFW